MRVHRRLLAWGTFFVALGAVLVAADLDAIGSIELGAVLRLWPLALVALGVSLVLRRTRYSLPLILVAAALPGLVIGAAVAAAPRWWLGDCPAATSSTNQTARDGRFEGAATVTLASRCGSFELTAAAGDAWHVSTVDPIGRPAAVTAGPRSLVVDTGFGDGWRPWNAERQDGTLALPTSRLDALDLSVLAGRIHGAVPGATVGDLDVTVNAGAINLDASNAAVDRLTARVNVGSLALDLPAGSNLTGSVRVGAGEVRLCVPDGLGLRITASGTGERVRIGGVEQTASVWQNPAWATATHRAELEVHVTFGALDIDPIGGCK